MSFFLLYFDVFSPPMAKISTLKIFSKVSLVSLILSAQTVF